jgi:hypothetical protein
MREISGLPEDHVRRIAFIREEMRFEVGVLHDRINAIISAEAFLIISFTMALGYVRSQSGYVYSLIASLLALLGFSLATLAWPGVNASYKIVVEWNLLLVQVLNEAHAASSLIWRPSVFATGDRRTHAEHRNGLLFARSIPIVFATAWAFLAALALVGVPR